MYHFWTSLTKWEGNILFYFVIFVTYNNYNNYLLTKKGINFLSIVLIIIINNFFCFPVIQTATGSAGVLSNTEWACPSRSGLLVAMGTGGNMAARVLQD